MSSNVFQRYPETIELSNNLISEIKSKKLDRMAYYATEKVLGPHISIISNGDWVKFYHKYAEIRVENYLNFRANLNDLDNKVRLLSLELNEPIQVYFIYHGNKVGIPAEQRYTDKNDTNCYFLAFDIRLINSNKFIGALENMNICDRHRIPFVPLIRLASLQNIIDININVFSYVGIKHNRSVKSAGIIIKPISDIMLNGKRLIIAKTNKPNAKTVRQILFDDINEKITNERIQSLSEGKKLFVPLLLEVSNNINKELKSENKKTDLVLIKKLCAEPVKKFLSETQ